ncbi:M48 family metalloprotease [Streptosporangiaceae bacterium NEAU-GS5]|nr:M48 family metalloprotease [Streptosporangiaceae bacterium NEAU-GS5]
MTSPAIASSDSTCPSCSAPISSDPRFTTWCAACDWNVDPSAEPAAKPAGRWRRRWDDRRRVADRATVERLYAEVSSGESPTERRDRAGMIAVVIAGGVHLSTLALAAGSVWLLINGVFLTWFLGVLGLAITFLIRPRLGRFRTDEWSLSRADAPGLYGLADRVADELGAPRADMIRITPDYNAAFDKSGLRRRNVLTIGLALWEVLTPQARVALLGHELGHARNGDNRRGLWLHSATEALLRWYAHTHPSTILAMGWDSVSMLGCVAIAALLFIPNKLTGWILLALHRLTLRSGQRAEYLADDLAAGVASSAAAKSMLEALVLNGSAETLLRRQTARHQKEGFYRASRQESAFDLWQELRDYIASVPEVERLRRRRVSALRMSSVDTTHPPTHLRIQMMDVRKPREAVITLSGSEDEAIAAELSAARARVARALLTLDYYKRG